MSKYPTKFPVNREVVKEQPQVSTSAPARTLPTPAVEPTGKKILPIDTAPKDARVILLYADKDGEGIPALWKTSRKFSHTTKKWEEHCWWATVQTMNPLDFTPNFWRER